MRGLFWLLLLTLLAWYAVSGYWYVCKIKNKCANDTVLVKKEVPVPVVKEKLRKEEAPKKAETPPIEKPVVKNPVPFTISGMPFDNISGENIYFNKDGSNAAFPNIPTALKSQFSEIDAYLKKNKEKVIEITGAYTNKDKKPATYENLGLARAANVKSSLLRVGINENQIITSSVLKSNLPSFKDKYTGVVTAKIRDAKKVTIEQEAAELKEIEDNIKSAPRTVYFETNSSIIIKTPDLQQYVKDLKRYLNANPTIKIKVTGHTDNIGKPLKNRELGLERAVDVKEYLIQNGIKQNQVAAGSDGADRPIESNSTKEGRKRNRRVEITFN